MGNSMEVLQTKQQELPPPSASPDVVSALVQWRRAATAPSPPMVTVLVYGSSAPEAQTAYWDGDHWYSTAGEPVDDVEWWSLMPALPAATLDANHKGPCQQALA